MQIEVIIEKKSHKLDAEEGKTILETLQEPVSYTHLDVYKRQVLQS